MAIGRTIGTVLSKKILFRTRCWGINKKYIDKIFVIGNILRENFTIKVYKNETDNILNLLVLKEVKLQKFLLKYYPIYLSNVKKTI